MLECVVNVSEGRRAHVLDRLAAAASAPGALLDLHADADHNRAVLTLAGPAVEEAARAVAAEAVAAIDLSAHEGAHPRLGAVDVVPFVPLAGSTMAGAVAARDRFAAWAAAELGLPCFLYGEGTGRSLPEVRKGAFAAFGPDAGPPSPHPTAGAAAVGARPVLVAYNVWLAGGVGVEVARSAAAAVRGPAVRALGLWLERAGRAQVSCNLIDPSAVGPDAAYDAVAGRAPAAGGELVGLLPARVLEAVPAERWGELGLSPERTIEARLGEAGLDGGSPFGAGGAGGAVSGRGH